MSEMELIITIILTLLLALAFLGVYEVNTGIKSPNPTIIELFLISLPLLFFAVLSDKFPKILSFRVGVYICIFTFIVFFLLLFFTRYHQSIDPDGKYRDLSESFQKYA